MFTHYNHSRCTSCASVSSRARAHMQHTSVPEATMIQAGRHQSKQRPVRTKMLATCRRIFAEIKTNYADFCKIPQNSTKIDDVLRNFVEICRILRNLYRDFRDKSAKLCEHFCFDWSLFRLVASCSTSEARTLPRCVMARARSRRRSPRVERAALRARADVHVYVQTYGRIDIRAYRHTYIHACMHAYIHTYIDTYL